MDTVGIILPQTSIKLSRDTKLDEETQLFLQQPSFNYLKEQVWKVATTNKIRHFIWQSLSGALAVNEYLAHRHIRVDRCCPRCGHSEESINHAIFTCPPALQCWTLSSLHAIFFLKILGRLWIICYRDYKIEEYQRRLSDHTHRLCGIYEKRKTINSSIILIIHQLISLSKPARNHRSGFWLIAQKRPSYILRHWILSPSPIQQPSLVISMDLGKLTNELVSVVEYWNCKMVLQIY